MDKNSGKKKNPKIDLYSLLNVVKSATKEEIV